MVSESRLCVVLIPSAKSKDFEKIFRPAAEEAQLTPVLAPSPEHPADRKRLESYIRSAVVVVVDLRDEDRRLVVGIGITLALDIQPLVVAESKEALPVSIDDLHFLEFDRDSTFAEDLRGEVVTKLEQLLDHDVGVDAASTTMAIDGAQANANFNRADAERLMSEMFLDGLSPQLIRDELLRSGAPRSWVYHRLRRRPGW